MFLFTIIPAYSKAQATNQALISIGRRSIKSKCFSVPLLTKVKPRSCNFRANSFAFLITCLEYFLNSSDFAFLRAIAIPAIELLNGPPCIPGKTEESILSDKRSLSPCDNSFLLKIRAPLGPLNVLCVVIITTSAYRNGEEFTPPAIKPAS